MKSKAFKLVTNPPEMDTCTCLDHETGFDSQVSHPVVQFQQFLVEHTPAYKGFIAMDASNPLQLSIL